MSLYIFSIGGSGVRVLHSLTMLLAAGVKIQSNQVIPVIIDNDYKNENDMNGNTKITLDTIKNYRNIRESVRDYSIFATDIAEPIIISICGTQLGTLKDVLGETATGIDNNLKENIHALYNDRNLDMPLGCGFVGNPNVGSVVLNYLFEQDATFAQTLTAIQPTDRIFIISSIFGGTGAAGFPLLLNILNNSPRTSWKKSSNLKGALSLLPYYNVGEIQNDVDIAELNRTDANDEKVYTVDSTLFDSKTLAAQLYYDNFVNGAVNAMYYAGDKTMRSTYPNYIGGNNQKNPAHIAEALGALSIVHFDNHDFSTATDTLFADLIFNDNTSPLPNDNNELRDSLIRLWMYRRFYLQYLPEYLKRNPLPAILSKSKGMNYSQNNYEIAQQDRFPKNMKDFLSSYEKWVKDLADSSVHSRKFEIVDTALNPNDEMMHGGFVGKQPITEKTFLGNIRDVETDFGAILGKKYQATDTISDIDSRLTKYATQAIDEIINTKMK